MQFEFRSHRLLRAAVLVASSVSLYLAPAQPSSAPAQKTASRSSLPEAALQQARQAEQHLASNQPDKAIAILKELDKQYPGQAAISLRLAEIHDTNNKYGAALFYYRRYIHLAGGRAREMAAARVSTLEVMAGVDSEAERVARELGESTRPVATPALKVERVIAAEAKDGSRVPLRSAEDVEQIERQGYVKPLPKSKQTPEITPGVTPIIIPETLSLPSQAASSTYAKPAVAAPSRAAQVEPVKTAKAPTPTPQPDEDALLAQAFVKADDPDAIVENVAAPPVATPEPTQKRRQTPTQVTTTPPPLQLEPMGTVAPARTPRPPVTVRATVASTGQAPTVAYTRPFSSTDSPRAAGFFNVTNVGGSYAQVSLINDLNGGVVTVSLTPMDNGEVLSAILMPGESKTIYAKSARYTISANASTTDYSPITLMNTQFEYKFDAGRQYTRRFTQSSLQQLN